MPSGIPKPYVDVDSQNTTFRDTKMLEIRSVLPDVRRDQKAVPALRIRSRISDAEMRDLLVSIREEDCAHSWRNYLPTSTFADVLTNEQTTRPTTLFFYDLPSKTASDGHDLAAVASIAERLSHDMLSDGMPVLARCYILPAYRGRGLYRQILDHRLSHCLERFGNTLRVVHLGTADSRIACAITKPSGALPSFIRLGTQRLSVNGCDKHVGGYFLLMPKYRKQLQDIFDHLPTAPEVRVLHAFVASMLDEAACAGCDLYSEMEDLYERALGVVGDDPVLAPLGQLLELCRHIPLERSSIADGSATSVPTWGRSHAESSDISTKKGGA